MDNVKSNSIKIKVLVGTAKIRPLRDLKSENIYFPIGRSYYVRFSFRIATGMYLNDPNRQQK